MLADAELKMQEAKERTEELLDRHIDDWVGLMADEYGKRVEHFPEVIGLLSICEVLFLCVFFQTLILPHGNSII